VKARRNRPRCCVGACIVEAEETEKAINLAAAGSLESARISCGVLAVSVNDGDIGCDTFEGGGGGGCPKRRTDSVEFA